jgi:hypothetical protein
MAFETEIEKAFKRVKVDTSDLKYKEFGLDYVRFKIGEKLYEVKIKEKK